MARGGRSARSRPTVADDGRRSEPAWPTAAEQALAERTADLQRLQAEYLNYKRRVDRDRELVRENATYAALAPIVEVLDTIDRAREHGDLDPASRPWPTSSSGWSPAPDWSGTASPVTRSTRASTRR